MTNYLSFIVGEDPRSVAGWHASSVTRVRAFAIALHIPVALWGIAGYLIGSRIFMLDALQTTLLATGCGVLIYMVERLIIATPKSWYVTGGRVGIGLVIALIGAGAIDLVVFDREVVQQLRESHEQRVRVLHEKALIAPLGKLVRARQEWMQALASADCEADGTCGSRARNLGPIYRELVRQVDIFRADYERALAEVERLKALQQDELRYSQEVNRVNEAGLL